MKVTVKHGNARHGTGVGTRRIASRISIARGIKISAGDPSFQACVVVGAGKPSFKKNMACAGGMSPRQAISKALKKAGAVVGKRSSAFAGLRRRSKRRRRR